MLQLIELMYSHARCMKADEKRPQLGIILPVIFFRIGSLQFSHIVHFYVRHYPPIIDFLTMFTVPLNWILHNAAMASKMPQLKQVQADADRPARRAAPCTSYLYKGRRSCDKQVKVVGRTSTVHGRQFITLSKLTTRCNDRPVVAKFSKSIVQDKVPQESILFFGDYPNFLITQCGYCRIKTAIL